MSNIKILLDNGHGVDTKGKQSPDGRLKEYAYSRDLARRLENALRAEGFEVERIVTEDKDISLRERCRRANAIDAETDTPIILISLHCDAKGYGDKWYDARGWSARISKNASRRSKLLARCLINAAEEAGMKVRRWSPGEPYWPQNLAICRDTHCPAVLTENLFQDNRADVDYLLSEEGRDALTRLHVEGIKKYVKEEGL